MRPGEAEAALAAADCDVAVWTHSQAVGVIAEAYPLIAKAVLAEAAKRIEDERWSVKGRDVAAVNQRAGLHVAGLIVTDALVTTE